MSKKIITEKQKSEASKQGSQASINIDQKPTQVIIDKDKKQTEPLVNQEQKPTQVVVNKDMKQSESVIAKDQKPTEIITDKDKKQPQSDTDPKAEDKKQSENQIDTDRKSKEELQDKDQQQSKASLNTDQKAQEVTSDKDKKQLLSVIKDATKDSDKQQDKPEQDSLDQDDQNNQGEQVENDEEEQDNSLMEENKNNQTYLDQQDDSNQNNSVLQSNRSFLQRKKSDSNNQKHPSQNQKNHAHVQQDTWKYYDFLFPSGRVAKLIKIEMVINRQDPFTDILKKLQLTEGFPVLNLIGVRDTNRGKFYAGIARACFNTDAIIVDNAITTGMEKYTIRRGLKLIGVAPEAEIRYPKQLPTYIDPDEISNGHTHLFLLHNKEINMTWGSEASFKINLCKKLAEGKNLKTGQKMNHKILNIFFGESDHYMNELQQAVLHDLPVLIVKGSQICNEFFLNQQKPNATYSQPSFGQLVKRGHFYGLNSLDSEDIAQFVHFFLTVTPY